MYSRENSLRRTTTTTTAVADSDDDEAVKRGAFVFPLFFYLSFSLRSVKFGNGELVKAVISRAVGRSSVDDGQKETPDYTVDPR